ncbi:MAG: alpha/beta hydrolase [Polyangia bacterium]
MAQPPLPSLDSQTAAPRSLRMPLGTGLGYHVLEWGADDPERDHTVLLVHGFLDFARSWEPMVSAGTGLANRYHVVAVDLRGHGDSDRVGPGGYYYFFDYIADLHEVVKRLGRERISLVGHSMGGSVTSYYAGSFPERIHRLALLEGLGPPEQRLADVPVRIKSWLAAWERVRTLPARRYATLAEAAARLRALDPLLSEELSFWLAEQGTNRQHDGTYAFKHDPLHLTPGPYPYLLEMAQALWKKVRCPVLSVHGELTDLDHPPEERARRLAAFQDAREVTLPGAGHMMQRHQPQALGRLLVDFLG